MGTLNATEQTTQFVDIDSVITITPTSATGSVVLMGANPGDADVSVTPISGSSPIVFGPYSTPKRFRIVCSVGIITYAVSRYAIGQGTVNADNAAAGQVGEFVTATAAPAAVSLSTGVAKTITSILLTPGDWDVEGVVNYTPAGTTSITQLAQGASNTADTLGAQDSFSQYSNAAQVPGANLIDHIAPEIRLSLAVTTTIYLVAKATFTVSTLTGGGTIRARRVR